jgi:hypothetical protein
MPLGTTMDESPLSNSKGGQRVRGCSIRSEPKTNPSASVATLCSQRIGLETQQETAPNQS